jgi:hypothetical protein
MLCLLQVGCFLRNCYYHFHSDNSVRNLHETDPSHDVAKFSERTGTGVLRRHLYEYHLSEWVKGCDQLGIQITAKGAMPAVNAFRGLRVEPEETARKPFSNEAFVDAIVEFIVGDDQVSGERSSLLFN